MWRHELINQEMTFWEFNNLAENITVSHRLQCGGQKRLEARKKSFIQQILSIYYIVGSEQGIH